MKTKQTSLLLSRNDLEELRKIAAQLGYFQERRPVLNKIGNVSALLRAIARGECRVVKDGTAEDHNL